MSNYVRKTDTVTRPPGDLVDASPAREHVQLLTAKGMPGRQIAKKAGISARTIYELLHGTRRTGGKVYQVKRCSPENLERILSVELEVAWDPAAFSPEKFRGVRESRNLARLGLARLAGLDQGTIQHWETGRSKPRRRENLEKALNALQATWEDVSGPPVAAEETDSYSMEFRDEEIPDYPCLVCGNLFRSRRLLAVHPHPKKKVTA